MAKQIELIFEGATYTLEFTRDSIKKSENKGLVIAEVGDKPMTMVPLLFHGAFLAHHPKMKQEDSDRIFESLGDKNGMLERLSEMYAEPLNELMHEPEETAGNVTWGANW